MTEKPLLRRKPNGHYTVAAEAYKPQARQTDYTRREASFVPVTSTNDVKLAAIVEDKTSFCLLNIVQTLRDIHTLTPENTSFDTLHVDIKKNILKAFEDRDSEGVRLMTKGDKNMLHVPWANLKCNHIFEELIQANAEHLFYNQVAQMVPILGGMRASWTNLKPSTHKTIETLLTKFVMEFRLDDILNFCDAMPKLGRGVLTTDDRVDLTSFWAINELICVSLKGRFPANFKKDRFKIEDDESVSIDLEGKFLVQTVPYFTFIQSLPRGREMVKKARFIFNETLTQETVDKIKEVCPFLTDIKVSADAGSDYEEDEGDCEEEDHSSHRLITSQDNHTTSSENHLESSLMNAMYSSTASSGFAKHADNNVIQGTVDSALWREETERVARHLSNNGGALTANSNEYVQHLALLKTYTASTASGDDDTVPISSGGKAVKKFTSSPAHTSISTLPLTITTLRNDLFAHLARIKSAESVLNLGGASQALAREFSSQKQ
eukprot:gene29652-36730_t